MIEGVISVICYVSARRVMALSFMPEKLDVERQIILEAVCVMPLSVFLLKIVKIKGVSF